MLCCYVVSCLFIYFSYTQTKKVLIQRKKLEKKLNLKQDALFTMEDHLSTVRDAETTKLVSKNRTFFMENMKHQLCFTL